MGKRRDYKFVIFGNSAGKISKCLIINNLPISQCLICKIRSGGTLENQPTEPAELARHSVLPRPVGSQCEIIYIGEDRRGVESNSLASLLIVPRMLRDGAIESTWLMLRGSSKTISLTRTKKKGLINKRLLVEEIRTCIDEYENIYVFSHENMRNKLMQDVRLRWRDNSRFFFCKKRIAALALGRTAAEELAENLHLISKKLVGNKALLFTNAPKEEVLEYFDNLKVRDYARAGNIATETFKIPEGLLSQFTHALEPYFRKLGLPTELRKGVPALTKPFTVCHEGDVLNPDQARILKLFERQTSYFKITLEFLWSQGGSFEDLGRTSGEDVHQKDVQKSED